MRKSWGIIVILTSFLVVLSGSIVASRIFVALLFVLCVYLGSKESTILNPYILFSAAPLSILIYVNLSGNYMLDLTSKTWGLAIINFVAFIMTLYYCGDYKNYSGCVGPSDKDLTVHTLLFTLIGLSSEIFELFVGRPLFLSSVFKLCTVPAIICALKSRKKGLIVFVISVFVGGSFGFLSKSAVLTYILALLIGIEKFFVKTSLGHKLVSFLSFIGVLVMILAFSFANKDRGSRSASDAVDYYEQYGHVNWNSHDALFMPYMYLTTPWANLQYVTETQDERTYGLWVLRPLIGYLQLEDNIDDVYRMQAYSSFNTFTYIGCHFKDFGYWLSIISSIFLGFFVKKVYSRFKVSKSALDVACYVYVGLAVLEMFFSNEFFSLSFPFTIVIMMGLYKLIFFRKNKPQLEH